MTKNSRTRTSERRVGRPPASEKGDKREALLASAVELFSERGFAAVELREIASRAGVTVGLIRHYFGSKSDLIETAAAHVTTRLQKVFEDILADLHAESATDFIDTISERTVAKMVPEYDLLKFVKHMVIELPEKTGPLFETYFSLFQKELNLLEATGKLNPQINKVWFSFLLMFIQLGPIFLERQIADILGASALEPNLAKARSANTAFVLKYGLVERD